MKKRISILLALTFVFAFLFTACGEQEQAKEEVKEATKTEEKADKEVDDSASKEDEQTTEADANETEESTEIQEKIVLKVGAPKAPPILPVLKMQEDKVLGENIDIEIDFWETPEQLIAMVQSDKNDMYAFPLTVVAKLYNKGMNVKLTNVNTWGVAYLLSKDPNVNTWADLKGKTIYIPLQSSPPDIMAQYFLNEAGLSPDDYEIIYTSKTELSEMMVAGSVDTGVMIEPLVSIVTTKNPEIKVVTAFEKDWQKIKGADSMIPNAGMGASGRFAEENHDLVVKFEEEYAKALDWVKQNPEEAGVLAEAKIGMKKPIIMKAIPNMGIHYKNAIDSKPELDEFYQMLLDFNPKTVGGEVPDENMYFK